MVGVPERIVVWVFPPLIIIRIATFRLDKEFASHRPTEISISVGFLVPVDVVVCLDRNCKKVVGHGIRSCVCCVGEVVVSILLRRRRWRCVLMLDALSRHAVATRLRGSG